MKCDKCGKNFPEKKVDNHHIIPLCFSITKLYSNPPFNPNETINLCQGCHNEIHKYILIPISKYIPNEYKPYAWQTKINCCFAIINFTKRWLKNEHKTN